MKKNNCCEKCEWQEDGTYGHGFACRNNNCPCHQEKECEHERYKNLYPYPCRKCGEPKIQDTQEESWEEQLEELNKKHGYHMTTDMGPARWGVLKSFISNLLQKAREEGLADGFHRGQILGEVKAYDEGYEEGVEATESLVYKIEKITRQKTLASLRERIEKMPGNNWGRDVSRADIIKLLENNE